MHFSNLSIRTRIGAGFAAIVAMVILLGSLALSELGAVNASTERIANGNLPSVKLAARMGDLTQLIRRAEARHVMSDSSDEWAAQDTRIAQTRKQLAELEPEITRLYDSEDERRELADYRSRRDAWYALWDQQLRPLSMQGPAHAAEAQKLYVGESSNAFNLTLERIQKIAQINADEAADTWADAQATYARSRLLVSACIAVAALLAIALAWVISSSIARPIDAAVQAAGAIASGDMTKSLHASGTDETARLLQGLEAMRQSLVKVVTHVRRGSERVAAASSEIAMGNQDLSARTEVQASALAESAASMEQLSAQVQHNAGNARQANQSASAASSVAARGGAAVGRVVQTMKEIHDASRRIADIIAVIDAIAFQTNILALNAAVEAARAREQGRGFAVVASEVRQLAGRCAEAAREIKQLIGASVERVEQGRTLVDEAGSTMEEVVTAIRRVTDLMGEIHSASNEQAAGVQQVGDAVAQMDQATQQNAALVEEMAAAAGSLRSQAAELVHGVAVFRLEASKAPADGVPLQLT